MRLWINIAIFMCLCIEERMAQLNSGCVSFDQCAVQVLNVLSIDDIVLRCRVFLNYIPCAQIAQRNCTLRKKTVVSYQEQVSKFYNTSNCSAILKEITTVPEMSTVSKKSLAERPIDMPTRHYSTPLPGFTKRRPKHKMEKRVYTTSGNTDMSSASPASSPTPPTSPASLTSSATLPTVADSVQLPENKTVWLKTDETNTTNAIAAANEVETSISSISKIGTEDDKSTRSTHFETATPLIPITIRQTSTLEILESSTSTIRSSAKQHTTKRNDVLDSSTSATLTTTTVLQTRNVNFHTSISSILTEVMKRGSGTTSTKEVRSSTTSGYRTSRNMKTQSALIDIDSVDYSAAANTEAVMFSGGILPRLEWFLHTIMLVYTVLC